MPLLLIINKLSAANVSTNIYLQFKFQVTMHTSTTLSVDQEELSSKRMDGS